MSTHSSTFSEEGRFERNPHDVYETPEPLVRKVLGVTTKDHQRILDVGAGSGVWGRVARHRWPTSAIFGVEIRDLPKPDFYDYWYPGDFMRLEGVKDFDLIMGNPPYSSKQYPKLAGQIVLKSLDMLVDGGMLILLLKTEFLNTQWRFENIFKHTPPWEVSVCVQRPSFYGNAKTNSIEYSAFLWFKGEAPFGTRINWMNWR